MPIENVSEDVYAYKGNSDKYVGLGMCAVFHTMKGAIHLLDSMVGETGYIPELQHNIRKVMDLLLYIKGDSIIIERCELYRDRTIVITGTVFAMGCKNSPIFLSSKNVWNPSDGLGGMLEDGSFGIRKIDMITSEGITKIVPDKTYDATIDPPIDSYEIFNYPRVPRYVRSTRRPVTNLKTASIYGYTNNCAGRYFLPVSRYHGVYYSAEESAELLEKYFFYEPESKVLLDIGYCVLFGSKMEAAYKLLRMTGEKIHAEDLMFSSPTIQELYNKYYAGVKASSTKDFINDAIVPGYFDILDSERDTRVPKAIQELINGGLLDVKDYSPPNFFTEDSGSYDWMDLSIRECARQLKIDTVLMQRCTGKYRLSTEIVCTRLNPYDYLCRIPDASEMTINFFNPTVWYAFNGLISRDGNNFSITKDFEIQNDTII